MTHKELCTHAGDFVQRFRSGAATLDVAPCFSALQPPLSPHDAYRVFADAKLSADRFAEHVQAAGGHIEALRDPDLAVRLGDRAYRYRDVAPFLLAAMAFSVEHAQMHASLLPDEYVELARPKVCPS